MEEQEIKELRSGLLEWFAHNRRPLPWRVKPSLYGTVVSELMCQQTQIDTVLPYFERWMRQFPDFASLAAADEVVVLKAWEGLGYYRRARMLHALAKTIVELPQLPETAEEWQQMPGIGPYTAAAIASIRLGEIVPVIDGNVIRILSRLTADARPIRSSAEAQKRFASVASQLIDPGQPGDFNEAMMELGATVCLKSRPLCLLCCLRPYCTAGKTGNPESYPNIVRAATRKVELGRVWVEVDGALLLHQAAADSSRLSGIWELPLASPEIPVVTGSLLATKVRGIGNQRIQERIYRATPMENGKGGNWQEWQAAAKGYRMVGVDRLDEITLSGPHRKWIRELLAASLH